MFFLIEKIPPDNIFLQNKGKVGAFPKRFSGIHEEKKVICNSVILLFRAGELDEWRNQAINSQ